MARIKISIPDTPVDAILAGVQLRNPDARKAISRMKVSRLDPSMVVAHQEQTNYIVEWCNPQRNYAAAQIVITVENPNDPTDYPRIAHAEPFYPMQTDGHHRMVILGPWRTFNREVTLIKIHVLDSNGKAVAPYTCMFRRAYTAAGIRGPISRRRYYASFAREESPIR